MSWADEIKAAIQEAVDEELDDLEVQLRLMATDCVNTIKNTAPKDAGKYAKSWKLRRVETALGPAYYVETKNGIEQPNAGMASWFENGTADRVTKVGYDRGRMTQKQAHIRKAFEEAIRKRKL